jgi:hypothetical protein
MKLFGNEQVRMAARNVGGQSTTLFSITPKLTPPSGTVFFKITTKNIWMTFIALKMRRGATVL